MQSHVSGPQDVVDRDGRGQDPIRVQGQIQVDVANVTRRHRSQVEEVVQVELTGHRQHTGFAVGAIGQDLDRLGHQRRPAVDQQAHFAEHVLALLPVLADDVEVDHVAAVRTRRHGPVDAFDDEP